MHMMYICTIQLSKNIPLDLCTIPDPLQYGF